MDNQNIDYTKSINIVSNVESNYPKQRKFKYLPPTYFKWLVGLTIVAHYLIPSPNLIPFPLNLFGAVFIVFGFVVMIWAHNLFGELKTAIRPDGFPTTLVVTGPFKISRNPMYLGFVSILFGIAMLLGSLISFLPPIILFSILHWKFISHEEKRLLEIFDDIFVQYKKTTRKWI
jgi:protein-S-isoprenylcysteine O-methyltransferase Ste14